MQFGFAFDVAVEEFGAHTASRQTGNRHEFNHLFGFRTGQRFFEVDVGIAFFGHGKRGTDLNGGRAPVFQGCFDFFKVCHAAGEYQWDFFAFQSQVFEYFKRFFNNAFELEFSIVHAVNGCRTQVAGRMGWVFDNDGIGQDAFFHPTFQNDIDTARFGQDREEGNIFVVALCHFRQIQRQACTHHNRVCTGFAGLTDVGGMVFDGFHDVDGNHAFAF